MLRVVVRKRLRCCRRGGATLCDRSAGHFSTFEARAEALCPSHKTTQSRDPTVIVFRSWNSIYTNTTVCLHERFSHVSVYVLHVARVSAGHLSRSTGNYILPQFVSSIGPQHFFIRQCLNADGRVPSGQLLASLSWGPLHCTVRLCQPVSQVLEHTIHGPVTHRGPAGVVEGGSVVAGISVVNVKISADDSAAAVPEIAMDVRGGSGVLRGMKKL